jgi:hypothetical protein
MLNFQGFLLICILGFYCECYFCNQKIKKLSEIEKIFKIVFAVRIIIKWSQIATPDIHILMVGASPIVAGLVCVTNIK